MTDETYRNDDGTVGTSAFFLWGNWKNAVSWFGMAVRARP